MTSFKIRPIRDEDRTWASEFIAEWWGSDIIVVHGEIYDPTTLSAFVATSEGERIGLITYHIDGEECEIVSLNSTIPSIGIGTKLLEAVKKEACSAGCRRVWLITTNDNLHALGFYQKRGFRLVAIYRDALDVSRKIKPEIPLIGMNGIPIRDEIELETILNDEG